MLDSAGRSARMPASRPCMTTWKSRIACAPARTSCGRHTEAISQDRLLTPGHARQQALHHHMEVAHRLRADAHVLRQATASDN